MHFYDKKTQDYVHGKMEHNGTWPNKNNKANKN